LTSINTVRTLANYVDVNLTDKTKIQCFIVRSNVNTETCETIDGVTMVYEIKNIKEVKDRKNKTEYIKSIYRITSDEHLKLFFQQETHNKIKDQLKVKL
jgi:hypothetical protein